jgi:hypothetical protein
MAIFFGTKDIDDFSVVMSPSIRNTITGISAEDFVSLDFMWTTANLKRFTYFSTKNGLDLVWSFQNIATEKIVSTTTFKNFYDTTGLPSIDNFDYSKTVNGISTETGSVGFSKIPTSKSDAANIFGDINNPQNCYEIAGTTDNDLIYGIDAEDYWTDNSGVLNLFNDNAGNDTVIGGDGNYDNENYSTNIYRVGAGNDSFTCGNVANDVFILASLSSCRSGSNVFTKTIIDFNADEGDVIELAKLATTHHLKFNTSRTYTSDTNATWKRGDIIFKTQDIDGDGDLDGLLLANTDRDKAPEIKIALIGITEFDSSYLNLDIKNEFITTYAIY